MKNCKNFYEEENENCSERLFKYCSTCYSIMFWNKYWECTFCKKVVKTDMSNFDGVAILKMKKD